MDKNLFEDTYTVEEILRLEVKDISKAALNAVLESCTPWQCKKNQAIVKQGEVCDKWIFVTKGLCYMLFTKNGKTATLFVDGGGAVFTSFHSIVSGEPSLFGVEALMDCQGYEIKQSKFKELCGKFPELMKFELSWLHHQLYCLEDRYARFAMSTPEQKWQKFWKQWSFLSGRTPQKLTQYIPLKVIAQYLSITQQTLSVLRRREMERQKNQESGKK